MNRKLAFIDVETTGLDPTYHELIEYAVIIELPDGSTQEYSAKIKPRYIERASSVALQINGYTPIRWANAIDSGRGAAQLAMLLKGTLIVAQNSKFDVAFVTELLKKHGLHLEADYHVIDTSTLVWEHLAPLGLEKLSLKPACEFIGIEPENDRHEALAGAQKCREIYHRLLRASWIQRQWWRIRNRCKKN